MGMVQLAICFFVNGHMVFFPVFVAIFFFLYNSFVGLGFHFFFFQVNVLVWNCQSYFAHESPIWTGLSPEAQLFSIQCRLGHPETWIALCLRDEVTRRLIYFLSSG